MLAVRLGGPAGTESHPELKNCTPNTRTNKRVVKRPNKSPRKASRLDALAPPVFYRGHELKLTNVTLPASVSSAASNNDMVQFIAQTANWDSGRIGSVIELIGFALDGCLVGGQSNNVADDKYNQFRITISHCTPGAIATFNPSVSSTISGRSFPGITRVLHDQSIDLASPGPDSVGYMPPVRHVKFYIPLEGIKVQFYDTMAARLSSDTIMASFVSDSAIGPNPGFASGKATLFYRDL